MICRQSSIRAVLRIVLTGLLLLAWGASWALDGFEYVEPSSPFTFEVERLDGNPIIHPDLPGLTGRTGRNINGPSLVRAPDWVDEPLGSYYLYFAHHQGRYIRLAYADALSGPWKIHRGGVLHIRQTDGRHHIASPDVHVDSEQERVRMYYHQPVREPTGLQGQHTWVALSPYGLHFRPLPEILGPFYFRTFRHGDWTYAVAKYRNEGAILYRSPHGLGDFEAGPRVLPNARHMALWQHGGHLYVFFSRIGDAPEQILVSRVENLDDDWRQWQFTRPQTVVKPELEFEGSSEPVRPSTKGGAKDPVHQLRDPAIFEENGCVYLLYSTAGEQGIAIAEIKLRIEGKASE